MPRHELLLPDLGLGEQPVTVSVWLVERGAQVKEGDPILEVLAGNAVVDLAAPADGVLAKRLVGEDERVAVGQRLAIIEAEDWA